MKEKDLEKCLDNLIIKGLIQEAEQDNADFEIAMRKMSDEDFLALIYDTVEEPAEPAMKDIHFSEEPVAMGAEVSFSIAAGFSGDHSDDWDDWTPTPPQNILKKTKTRLKGWKIWTAAIASIAAILLIVFIPAYREMNSRLCESALLASTAFQGPTRGVDIASMSKDEVKEMLPELEMEYSASKHSDNISQSEQPKEYDSPEYYIVNTDPVEAGMDLMQAYLKLNRKDDAIIVLRELAENDADPEFKEYCRKILEILE